MQLSFDTSSRRVMPPVKCKFGKLPYRSQSHSEGQSEPNVKLQDLHWSAPPRALPVTQFDKVVWMKCKELIQLSTNIAPPAGCEGSAIS
jgi:hypothetical protein